MYYLYLLRCKNGAIYTGIALDVHKRLKMHKAGKGARYTKVFGVSRLLYTEKVGAIGKALKRELEVKRWSPQKKRALARSTKGAKSL